MAITQQQLLEGRKRAQQAGVPQDQIEAYEAQLLQSQGGLQEQQPETGGGNFMGDLVKSMVEPFKNTGKMAKDALVGAEMFVNDPTYRKATLGGELSESDAKYLTNLFDQEVFDEADEMTRGDIAKQTVKNVAGVGSYAIPGSIGGKGVMGAAKAGLVSGGLSGLSQSDMDNWMDTAVDIGSGALIGGGTGVAVSGAGKLLNRGKADRAAKATGKTFDKLINQYQKLADEGDEAARATLDDLIKARGTSQAAGTGAKIVEKYKAPTAAEKAYLSQLQVPSKLSRRLKPQETVSKMIDYDIGGSLEDIGNKAATVTGEEGFVTKLHRDVIGDLPDELDIGNAMQSVRGSLDNITDLNPNEEGRILEIVRRSLPKGTTPTTANALDVMDAIRNLEKIGYENINSSTSLSKNLKAEQIGSVFLNVADDLENIIEGKIGSSNIQNRLTPEVLEQARLVSPKLAEDIANAQTLADLRAIQAPFVRMQGLVDSTLQSQLSTFGTVADELKGFGNIASPIRAAGKMLSTPEVNTRVGRAANTVGGAAKATGEAVGSTANAIGSIPGKMSQATKGFLPEDIVQRAIVPTVSGAIVGSEPQQAPTSIMDQPVDTDAFVSTGSPTTTQQDTVSPDMLEALILSDLSETGGKNLALFEKLQEQGIFGGGGETDLTAQQQNKLMALSQAESIVGEIESAVEELNLSTLGPVARARGVNRNIGAAIGTDVNASTYKSFREGIANVLSKSLGQSGSLSDTDIERAIALIPELGDSEKEAARKIQTLKELISSSKQGVMTVPDTVSVDDLNSIVTSGF